MLDGAFDGTGRIVAGVDAMQLGAPTPCSEWDVRALINHVTSVVARMRFSAARAAATPALEDEDFVANDPGPIFQRVAAATLAAWSEPGALDGTCVLPNGWDLAVATGQDATIDPALAGAALEFSQGFVTDELRGPGRPFRAPVAPPVGASPTDELVAFLGRRT